MPKTFFLLFATLITGSIAAQDAVIGVDAASGNKAISPFIYGKNGCLSDNPSEPLTTGEWQFLRDAGIKFVRENQGNNATKYNWRRKLSSHPDWYNNVYLHDWDYAAGSLSENLPGVYGMWAFQLIGKTASNTQHNFNDWGYNQSQWWSGVYQNLAGSGVVNAAGGNDAATDGDPSLYLMNWPADSTVAILDKWFGVTGLGYDQEKLRYWSMDNEPEIWFATHDDVMAGQISAEEFMQRYFTVAKKARALFPEIKLMGPVPANEWQWYSWNNSVITHGGKNYVWLEYFIKRIADEQLSSGIRLLDVLDIHFYPSASAASNIVQLHRVFFDETYVFPEANGVKLINGTWDNSVNKEYILKRCSDWLTEYLGEGHGVTFSVSETGINGDDPNVTAIWYASTLGTFADTGVEIFTPWSWKTGMWETIHMFSRYAKGTRVQSTSSLEEFVSAYSSFNTGADSLTVILVNRSTTSSLNSKVNISNFNIPDGYFNTLALEDLPAEETFKSHTVNALKKGTIHVDNSSFSVTLPPLSITALLLSTSSSTQVNEINETGQVLQLFQDRLSLIIRYKIEKPAPVRIEIFDMQGKKLAATEYNKNKASGIYTLNYDLSQFSGGIYVVRLKAGNDVIQDKFVVLR